MYWKRPKKSVLPYLLAFFIGEQSVFKEFFKDYKSCNRNQKKGAI